MLCFIRFPRILTGLLAALLPRLRARAAAVYQRHRALLVDDPGYRAQATAGTAALLTLLRVPRPLATQLLRVLRRTSTTQRTELDRIDPDDV